MEYARKKYCNKTKATLRTYDVKLYSKPAFVSNIVWSIVNYTKSNVDKALSNLTHFCENPDILEQYQRAGCPFFKGKDCPQSYRSTKGGDVKYRTQHRPVYRQSTKHYISTKKILRNANGTGKVVQLSEADTFVNEPSSLGVGVSLSDASITSASASVRRKRHATVSLHSTSSPKPSASVGLSPTDSKVSGGHSPKLHSDPLHSKKGTKTRQAKSNHSAKREKKHRLRSRHAMRSGNSSRSKSRSNPLNIKLPLTFENASAYGWVKWHPSNSSSEMSKNDSNSSVGTTKAPSSSGPQFRAQNITDAPKNLRAGTTVERDMQKYEPVSRNKRDVEATEKNTQKTEEIKEDVQGLKPSNDSRRYFQSRRFR